MSKSIVIATAHTIDLKPRPVFPTWVLAGTPETRSRELARSQDRLSSSMVWDCTAGRFNWQYNSDETLVVLEGEAFITNEKGEEHRIGPGDVVFFPAGTSATWRVTSYIRKVAFFRVRMPPPVAFGVRAWNFVKRTVFGQKDGWQRNGS